MLTVLTGARVTLVSETFQHTRSFKYRAAHRVVTTSASRHFIAASSGNFGLALAAACTAYGRRCSIVTPTNAPPIKIERMRAHGAAIELVDVRTRSRAAALVALVAQQPDAQVVNAAEDDAVLEGNATLGAELAAREFDCVLVPVGGGGLAAGIALALERAGSPSELVGVEPSLSGKAHESLRSGRIVELAAEPETIADGARVVRLGTKPFEILLRRMGGVECVSEEQIAAAMQLIHDATSIGPEPTAALAVAALSTRPERFRGRSVCCVISGGNVRPA